MLLDWAHVQGSSVVQHKEHKYDAKKKQQKPQSCLSKYLCKVLIWSHWYDAHSEPYQISKVEDFAKIVNSFYQLYFIKNTPS